MTRALVIDDSPVSRDALAGLLHRGGITVAGTGRDGQQAVELVQRLAPDVVLMDVHMPVVDGLEATRQIMALRPTPIVVVSGVEQAGLMFAAQQAGALAGLPKPAPDDAPAVARLLQTVRLMAEVPVVRRWLPPVTPPPPPACPTPTGVVQEGLGRVRVIGVAASTGGPAALAGVLGGLPTDFPVPVLVVQHVGAGFAPGLAAWLSGQVRPVVRLAEQGAPLQPGITLAPDYAHLRVGRAGWLVLDEVSPPYRSLRPSANVLFHSLAEVYGSGALGVVLSGLGDDGAEGVAAMRATGGAVVAQAEGECAARDMPGAAVRRGAQALELAGIAALLQALKDGRRMA